jgi:hypothetical protein
MKRALFAVLMVVLNASAAVCAEQKIDVFPPSHYDQASIYLNLAIFWIGVVGLIVILKMKLREIERVQALERDKNDESEAPLLE